MQTGYLYAFYNNYDIAIQIDGDGQHNPLYVDSLIKPILDNKADMVIGSRYINHTSYKSSAMRRIGMIFFSGLIKVFTGKKIYDTTSGFRAVNKQIIKYFSQNYPTDYPEVDVLVSLLRNNFKILEVPVEMNERKTGKSSITPFRSIYYMIKVSLAVMINSIRTEKCN
jgi:glycosyltransferase involved in cell wall biosynthesis